MPSITIRRRRLYRGYRRIHAFACPTCGFQVPSDDAEHYASTIRARRNRRIGRYISVRQLRMFIEIARSQIDWNRPWVTVDELYHIIEHISQMDDEDVMDVNKYPLAINDVLEHLEGLNLD